MTAYDHKTNCLIYTRQDLIASTTAESTALAIATYASWINVQSWNSAQKIRQVELPNQAAAYSSVKEFDFVLTCDASGSEVGTQAPVPQPQFGSVKKSAPEPTSAQRFQSGEV